MKYKFVCTDRFISVDENLKNLIDALETGVVVKVGTDSLGHGDNNATQEHYKRLLEEHYGDNLEVVNCSGVYSYSYDYRLKKRTK